VTLLVPPLGWNVGGYRANAVAFDGVNDYLTRGAGLTGAADSKMFTFSAWLKTNADGVAYEWFNALTTVGGSTALFRVVKQTSDRIALIGANSAQVTIVELRSAIDSVEAADGWVHILASCDLADTAKRHLYIDDVSDLAVVTYTDDTIDFTFADWAVGAKASGTSKLNGDLADLWFEDGLYTDFSVAANRRKFITASLKPVYLGANGEIPTGTSPIVFLSGATASWEANKGTGGGFTENGALTDAATSPSD
jgi:hypothetical protein